MNSPEPFTFLNHQTIANRVNVVRERIADALSRSGRSGDEVTLVAVTKYAQVNDETLRQLYDVGCRDFGESRPQQLVEKASRVTFADARWHQIGSLQKNKVRKLLPHASLIHSVDSLALAEAINRIASEECLDTVAVLLEVNVSGDATKGGFALTDLEKQWESLIALPRLRIDGMMSMSGLDATPAEIRWQFSETRELRDRLRSATTPLTTLSMGMSDDFEIAIAEGSTMVRIGSLLFG
ncbi:MAG: YggS family pyridoxal phosphate-dependent enzyme [Thermoguttaceae bacterium]